MLIERQNGMTGRKNIMYRTRQTVEHDMYPFIIAAKSAQNQPQEFYWKKCTVALRITMRKFDYFYFFYDNLVKRKKGGKNQIYILRPEIRG
jgi:hypothetical protein